MITTEGEYAQSLRRLHEHDQYVASQRESFLKEGFTKEEIEELMQPIEVFHLQLKDEMERYGAAKQGKIPPIDRFTDVGPALIALRIYLGISPSELARRMGVHKSVVSRDERNEYRGITVARLQAVVDALSGEKASHDNNIDNVDLPVFNHPKSVLSPPTVDEDALASASRG